MISIVDNNPADVIAIIPVLGRPHGPVLQDISTKTVRTRQLNIECVIEQPELEDCTYASLIAGKPDVEDIIDEVEPDGTKVFKTEDSEGWSPSTLRYTRNVTWTWEL